MKRLAIITSHPVQYNTPLFEMLQNRGNIEVMVFYTWGESVLQNKYDPGFGKVIDWDIPLLNGYNYTFLKNTSENMGADHFGGIINPDINEVVAAFKPDALLVYGWSFNSHLKVMRYFKNKAMILFRGDSTLLDKSGLISKIKRWLFLNWVYRFVDISFYVGKSNYDYYRRFGLKPAQLKFAPHAIDNVRFACTEESCHTQALNFREQLNIAPSDFIFLFAGKLEPKKNPELLLRAFVTAALKPEVHLVIVGNGILEGKLKQNFSSFKNIHFLDFQNQLQMPAVYRMCDVFVLPSQGPGETWGLAINEAMANGRAVIVSDKCGGAADLVIDSVNGYVFTSGDESDLAMKLQLMYEQKEKLPLMQAASLNIIKDFSIEKFAIAIEENLVQ